MTQRGTSILHSSFLSNPFYRGVLVTSTVNSMYYVFPSFSPLLTLRHGRSFLGTKLLHSEYSLIVIYTKKYEQRNSNALCIVVVVFSGSK